MMPRMRGTRTTLSDDARLAAGSSVGGVGGVGVVGHAAAKVSGACASCEGGAVGVHWLMLRLWISWWLLLLSGRLLERAAAADQRGPLAHSRRHRRGGRVGGRG